MSTLDVPGANPVNGDTLKVGCWALADDGKSYVFVESTENGRVVFLIFDTTKEPVVEYRDAMSSDQFNQYFSIGKNNGTSPPIKWTWHDKSPFPWDIVIKRGARDGGRYTSAMDVLDTAEKIRDSQNRLYPDDDDDDRAPPMTAADRVRHDLINRGRAIVGRIARRGNRPTGPNPEEDVIHQLAEMRDRIDDILGRFSR